MLRCRCRNDCDQPPVAGNLDGPIARQRAQNFAKAGLGFGCSEPSSVIHGYSLAKLIGLYRLDDSPSGAEPGVGDQDKDAAIEAPPDANADEVVAPRLVWSPGAMVLQVTDIGTDLRCAATAIEDGQHPAHRNLDEGGRACSTLDGANLKAPKS